MFDPALSSAATTSRSKSRSATRRALCLEQSTTPKLRSKRVRGSAVTNYRWSYADKQALLHVMTDPSHEHMTLPELLTYFVTTFNNNLASNRPRVTYDSARSAWARVKLAERKAGRGTAKVAVRNSCDVPWSVKEMKLLSSYMTGAETGTDRDQARLFIERHSNHRSLAATLSKWAWMLLNSTKLGHSDASE